MLKKRTTFWTIIAKTALVFSLEAELYFTFLICGISLRELIPLDSALLKRVPTYRFKAKITIGNDF